MIDWIMTRRGFSLTGARARKTPLGGPGGLAVASLVAGVLCVLVAAFAA